jgi:hypothetical protein
MIAPARGSGSDVVSVGGDAGSGRRLVGVGGSCSGELERIGLEGLTALVAYLETI